MELGLGLGLGLVLGVGVGFSLGPVPDLILVHLVFYSKHSKLHINRRVSVVHVLGVVVLLFIILFTFLFIIPISIFTF